MSTIALCGNVCRTVSICCASLMLAVAIAGCGGPTGPKPAPVTGTVTRGGEPLSGADVMFMPQDGAPSSGKTDASGRFELLYNDGRPGAVVGKHRVVISLPGPELPPPTGEEEEPPADVQPAEEFYKEAEVKSSGENDFTFDVAE